MSITGLKQILSRPRVLVPAAIAIALVFVVLIVIVIRSNKPVQAAPRLLEVGVVQVKQEDVPLIASGSEQRMVINADIKAQVVGYLLRQDYKEGSLPKANSCLRSTRARLSLRKSSSSKNGSKYDVFPKPKARRKWTPAPLSVGLDLASRFTGRMDT